QGIVANQLVKGRTTDVKPYENAGRTFGPALRDRAMILETLDLMGRRQEAERLLLSVAAGLDNDSWYSTQTTAFALLAIGKFGGSEQRKNTFTYTLNGESANVEADTYLHRINVDMSRAGNALRIENK